MPYATSRGAKSLTGSVSKLFTAEEVLEIQGLLGLSRSKQEIMAELRRKYPKFLRVDEQKLRDGINGIGVGIYNEKKRELKAKEASVENLEEREKKYFQRIFDNNEEIESLKSKVLESLKGKVDKITARDYKDLCVAQAIGTRDLRDYKVRRAGKLTGLTAEELQQAKVELVQQLTMRKGGETLEIKYTKESEGVAVKKVEEMFEEVDSRVVQQAETDIVREQEA